MKVYTLGEGEESKRWLSAHGRTVEQLFLSHVTKLARAIREEWPHLSVIMWDDMMRGMSQDTLTGEWRPASVLTPGLARVTGPALSQPAVWWGWSSPCCGTTPPTWTWTSQVGPAGASGVRGAPCDGVSSPLRPSASLLEKYHGAGLTGLWAASSFKGSTSVYTCVPSTLRHVDNHLQWLKVAAALSPGVTLQGIAITGWQRSEVRGQQQVRVSLSRV